MARPSLSGTDEPSVALTVRVTRSTLARIDAATAQRGEKLGGGGRRAFVRYAIERMLVTLEAVRSASKEPTNDR